MSNAILEISPYLPDVSSSAMLPPTQSPRIGRFASPTLGDSARNNHTSPTPGLHRASHAFSPSLNLPPYASLPDTERSVLPSQSPQLAFGGMLGYGNFQVEQSPPFNPQENYLGITCDGSTVVPNIEAKVDRGFFYTPDHVWTCYRRNYIAVTVSFGLTPWIHNGGLYLNRGNKRPEQIISMAVSLAASVSNSGGKPTELFQHSPKRDKGPQLPMKKELLSPTPPQNSYHFGGNILESAPNNAILAGPQLALQKDSGMSQGYSLAASNYQHTFERVQFKSATSNNGKRRAQQQQYFHLIVELWANVQAEGDPEPQWAQVAARSTAPIVVRGRSPRTYSNETPHNPNEIGRGSSMPGPRYQGNGLNGGVTYKGSSSALGMNGPEQHNLEQPGEELSCHEWKGKLAETAEKCKIVEKPRYLLPRSGDERIPMLSTPQRTGPNKETQLSSNRSQNLVKVLPVSPNTEGTGLLDVLGAGTRTYTFDHTVAPGNLQRLLSGLEKKTDEIKKMLEEFRNLPSKPASPTPLTQKGNMLTVDRPSEVQRIQDVNENSVSRSLTSDVLSSRPSPATAELPKYSNLPISGLECNSCANGPSFLSKSVEISKNEDNLTSILQPKRMDQRESPSLRAQISTDIIISATEDDTHSFQTIVGPKENVVLLSRPNDSDVSGSPNVTNSLPSSNSPMSRLNIPGDSSVGDAIEELGTIEMDGKSGEAFDECEVSVKSALDVAVVIIKDLLIRELLGYAFPEAINAIEGSHPSSSGPRTGSASNSAFSNLYSCTSNSQAPKRRKRTRGDGHDLGDDDIDYSNDDDDDRPKKKSKSGSPDQLPHRRLKCPFYQRQPEKYKKEVCRGGGFADLAKLKDHIILMHTKPLRCSRCWQEMESEDTYAEHLQRENICMIDAEPQDDRIRRQLLNRLDFKKAPYANARNIEDKWNILFLVLFPNDSKIPSPYEQQGLRLCLERALSEALEEKLLAPMFEPIMLRTKELIPAIIESCRLKLTSTSPNLRY